MRTRLYVAVVLGVLITGIAVPSAPVSAADRRISGEHDTAAFADRRYHVRTGETISYQDDFRKVIRCGRYLVCNHGYNRIGDQDWKLRQAALTARSGNPLYAELLAEMANKPDKAAFYVFINGTRSTRLRFVLAQALGRPIVHEMIG